MRKIALFLISCSIAMTSCVGGDQNTVQARFSDIGDLAAMAPVFFADVKVGEVKNVRLSGNEAVVTFGIDPEANVPANVVARLRRTSVLGERVVDLVIAEGETPSADSLADGAMIERTVVRADLENLVVEGSDVFGALGASELASMIDEGAKGFGGRGEQLGEMLTNFEVITDDFSAETETIKSLLTSLESFNRKLAQESEAHRAAVQNTARSIEVLEQESEKLEAALGSLARLATVSRDILDEHVDQMARFFNQMRVVLTVLADEQNSIRMLLRYAPRHNRNTQLVEYAEFNQVFQEFVICGFNDNSSDRARTCRGDD